MLFQSGIDTLKNDLHGPVQPLPCECCTHNSMLLDNLLPCGLKRINIHIAKHEKRRTFRPRMWLYFVDGKAGGLEEGKRIDVFYIANIHYSFKWKSCRHGTTKNHVSS